MAKIKETSVPEDIRHHAGIALLTNDSALYMGQQMLPVRSNTKTEKSINNQQHLLSTALNEQTQQRAIFNYMGKGLYNWH